MRQVDYLELLQLPAPYYQKEVEKKLWICECKPRGRINTCLLKFHFVHAHVLLSVRDYM